METVTHSEQIYRIMADRHMTQSAVAKAAGIPPKLFNNILRGRKLLKPELVVPICKALNCTPNELFGYGGGREGSVLIGEKEYHQIVIMRREDREVIAVIADDSVVEHSEFQVLLA